MIYSTVLDCLLVILYTSGCIALELLTTTTTTKSSGKTCVNQLIKPLPSLILPFLTIVISFYAQENNLCFCTVLLMYFFNCFYLPSCLKLKKKRVIIWKNKRFHVVHEILKWNWKFEFKCWSYCRKWSVTKETLLVCPRAFIFRSTARHHWTPLRRRSVKFGIELFSKKSYLKIIQLYRSFFLQQSNCRTVNTVNTFIINRDNIILKLCMLNRIENIAEIKEHKQN